MRGYSMDFYILDRSFNRISVIDSYETYIWTKRYYMCGDFELHIPAKSSLFEVLDLGYYVTRPGDKTVMIIESLKLDTNSEQGDYITVSGRSFESILERRILTQTFVYSAVEEGVYAWEVVHYLIYNNIVNPTDEYRKIDIIDQNDSEAPETEDMILSSEEVTFENGKNILECVSQVCQQYGIGIKAQWNEKYGTEARFTLCIYGGKDRSRITADGPRVEFSPQNDNFGESSYILNGEKVKNAVKFRIGSDSYYSPLWTPGQNAPSGLDRREVLVSIDDIDLSSIKSISQTMKERAMSELAANYSTVTAFDGTVTESGTYIYGEDYELGDIVKVVNEYDISARARITEIIDSGDAYGTSLIPTFEYQERGAE